jgi:hypothetical protein
MSLCRDQGTISASRSFIRKSDVRWRALVSLLCLAIICCGVDYAIGRERLRDPDHLHDLYQQTNKEFFGGELSDAKVKLRDLTPDRVGETYKETEDKFVILLDPNWNTSDAEALRTMRHEACHVATWDVMDPEDPHGLPFQECMKRFAGREQLGR